MNVLSLCAFSVILCHLCKHIQMENCSPQMHLMNQTGFTFFAWPLSGCKMFLWVFFSLPLTLQLNQTQREKAQELDQTVPNINRVNSLLFSCCRSAGCLHTHTHTPTTSSDYITFLFTESTHERSHINSITRGIYIIHICTLNNTSRYT